MHPENSREGTSNSVGVTVISYFGLLWFLGNCFADKISLSVHFKLRLTQFLLF